jgi:uncharacterized protein DUF1275
LLRALTPVTSLIDAVSILRLGRIFVTNLTGNVVFTGFSHFPDPPPPPYATQSWPIPRSSPAPFTGTGQQPLPSAVCSPAARTGAH